MKHKTTSIILLILSALLFGMSLSEFIKMTNGSVEFRYAWPWLLGLFVGGTGIIVIARDLKK